MDEGHVYKGLGAWEGYWYIAEDEYGLEREFGWRSSPDVEFDASLWQQIDDDSFLAVRFDLAIYPKPDVPATAVEAERGVGFIEYKDTAGAWALHKEAGLWTWRMDKSQIPDLDN